MDVRPMVDIEDFLDAMTVEDMDIMVYMVNKVKMRDKVYILEKSEEVDLVTIFTGGGGKMEGQLARMVSSLLEHSSDTTILSACLPQQWQVCQIACHMLVC